MAIDMAIEGQALVSFLRSRIYNRLGSRDQLRRYGEVLRIPAIFA
jgi:hypothetical protein